MSELINKTDNRATIRWKLLTSASALVLTAYVSSASLAKAEDASHPSIWIELGGQYSQQENGQQAFLPPFVLASQFDGAPPASLEKGPPEIWDKNAKLTYQPQGSDWVFSAGVRYGKNSRSKTQNLNQLTVVPTYSGYYNHAYNASQYVKTESSEKHTILDFRAGKDVGLGRLGNSVLSLGVRLAQLTSNSATDIRSEPTNRVFYTGFHRFYANFAAQRKFVGIGPSLSWEASTILAGNPAAENISVDWGANGAILFGRQRVKVHHQTTEIYQPPPGPLFVPQTTVYQTPTSPTRTNRVTVPNLGAFAGVSWHYAAAKVTMGYRADYFFGVLDGGIDTAKKEDRAFYGPFLSIVVGIGD